MKPNNHSANGNKKKTNIECDLHDFIFSTCSFFPLFIDSEFMQITCFAKLYKWESEKERKYKTRYWKQKKKKNLHIGSAMQFFFAWRTFDNKEQKWHSSKQVFFTCCKFCLLRIESYFFGEIHKSFILKGKMSQVAL